MNSKLNLSVVFLLMLGLFCACNGAKDSKTGFTLSGTIEGAADGAKLELVNYSEDGVKRDTAIIKEGQFVIKGSYTDPTLCYLSIAESRAFTQVYIENTEMTLTTSISDFQNMKVTGSKAHDDYAIYTSLLKPIQKKYEHIMPEFYTPGITDERKSELEKELEKQQKEVEALNEKFVNDYPAAYHSATLVARKLSGKSAVETEKMVKRLDPVIQKNPIIIAILEKTSKLKGIEVGIDQMMANVSNVSYKVDEKFNGKELKNIVYLGMFSDNKICALKNDGTVLILDVNGKEISSFKGELNGKPSSLAVDKANNIYLLSVLQEEVEKKVRGKVHKRMVPKAVECSVFDIKGTKKSTFKLEGIVSSTGAKVVDNNIIVADCRGGKLSMFDKTNGKVGPVMDNMRPCCGILDFSVNEKKEILVANLGAFRVQGFDFSGKQLLSFGQRGKTLDDFHGCCNPVSVTSLSSGAIVTVEKDPTRIKVYSKEGAKQIAGIEELVKGCSFIPMIVDSKDNIYLASGEKGMVKCISVN